MYFMQLGVYTFDVVFIYGRERVYFDELFAIGIAFSLLFLFGTFVSIILLPKVYLVILSQALFIIMLYLHNINLPTDILKVFFISNAISIVIVLLVYLVDRIIRKYSGSLNAT